MRHALSWVLVLAPVLPLVALSLSYRRIIQQKMSEAKRRLSAFASEYDRAYGAAGGDEVGRSVLDTELGEFYNWRTYTVPLVMTALIASTLTGVALVKLGLSLGLDSAVEGRARATLPAVLIAGGGAYLWGLNDLIKRHRSADLSSSALHVTWLRMLISAAVGGLMGYIFASPADLVAAFALGGVPIDDIKQFVISRVDLRIDRGKAQEPDLHLIQGMSRSMRDRLADENIETVQTLAFADPVRLLFRTNIEWNVVLDWVDQSMLINFVGENIGEVRHQAGVRGAIELASAYVQSVNGTKREKAAANAVIEKLGAVVGGREIAQHLAYQLYYDPLVQFVWAHWDAARPGTELDDELLEGEGDDDDVQAPGTGGASARPGGVAAPAGPLAGVSRDLATASPGNGEVAADHVAALPR